MQNEKVVNFEFPYGVQSDTDERRYMILEVVDLSNNQAQMLDKQISSIGTAVSKAQEYIFGKEELDGVTGATKKVETTPEANVDTGEDKKEPKTLSQNVAAQVEEGSRNLSNSVLRQQKPVIDIKKSYQELRQNRKHSGVTRFQVQLPFPDTFTESSKQSWSKSKGVLGHIGGKLEGVSVPLLGMNQTKFIGQMQNTQGTRKPIANPGYFQDYEGPEPRSFEMKWTLIPNSVDEAQDLQLIIYNLKKFAQPSSQLNDTILLQPYSFNITLMNDIISPVQGLDLMVCSNISIDWGTKSTLYPDGQPKVVTLSMSFTERKAMIMSDY